MAEILKLIESEIRMHFFRCTTSLRSLVSVAALLSGCFAFAQAPTGAQAPATTPAAPQSVPAAKTPPAPALKTPPVVISDHAVPAPPKTNDELQVPRDPWQSDELQDFHAVVQWESWVNDTKKKAGS